MTNNIKHILGTMRYARTREHLNRTIFADLVATRKFAMPHFKLIEDFKDFEWRIGEVVDLHIETYPVSQEEKKDYQYRWYLEKGVSARYKNRFYLFFNEKPFVEEIDESTAKEFKMLPDYWFDYVLKG